MFNLVLLALINLFGLGIFFIVWNQISTRLPLKRVVLVIAFLDIGIVLFALLTGVSAEQLILYWTQLYEQSLTIVYIVSFLILILFIAVVTPFLYQEFKALKAHKHRNRYLLFVVSTFFITLLMWMLVGFDSFGQWETWLHKYFLIFGPPHQFVSEVINRLSVFVLPTVFHTIDPNTFIAYNLAHFIFTWFKALTCFAVLKQFELSDLKAFGITAVFWFYPTLTEAISLRNIMILISVVLFLFAIYTFISYVKKPTRFRLLVFFVVMFCSVTFNEYYFVHIIFFPILLFYFERRISAKLFNFTVIWYILPIAYVGYFYLIANSIDTYGEHIGLSTDLTYTIDLVIGSIERLLITNWGIAITTPIDSLLLVVITVIGTLIVAGISLYFISAYQTRESSPIKWDITQIAIGIAIIACATIIFGLFVRRRPEWRIHSIGSLGASLVIVNFLSLIVYRIRTKYTQHIFVIGIAVFFGLAFHQTIHRQQYHQDIAQNKQDFLAFATNYNAISEESVWVFFTYLSEEELIEKLDYFFVNHPSQIAVPAINVANPNININKMFFCSIPFTEECKFHTNKMRFKGIRYFSPEELYRYEEMVFFMIEEDLSVHLLETIPDEPWQLSYAAEKYSPFDHVQFNSQN